MLRLHIRIPCSSLVQPVSIIDTPGLDSPTVWQQIHALVQSKAFLFVWVGAVDAATAFGLQGRRLVELYRTTGHPLPPALVLTKWDRLKALPEFRGNAVALASQAQSRLAQLREGLLPPDHRTSTLVCRQAEDIEELVAALECRWRQSEHCATAGLEQQWVLCRSLAIGSQSVYKGSALVPSISQASSTEEIERSTDIANAAQYLRSLPLPAHIKFRTDEAEPMLLLASANASAMVSKAAGPEQEEAASDIGAFWDALLPLLSGISEPLRISRRLHKIVVATQRVVNILLKDDDQAKVFSHNRDALAETQRQVVNSFSDRVDQYFAGLPRIVERPDFVPAGCRPEVSLADYRPPRGLSRHECATCLIPSFIREAHEGAKDEKSEFKYVRAVATVTIERWQSKFLENMMRFERDCLTELESQIGDLMQISGLIDHSQWEATLQSLITSPIEAVGFGCLAGSVVGGYCGLIAEAVAGVGLGVGVGLGMLVAVGIASISFEDSALAKRIGVWNYGEGQYRVAQTVLDILNKPDFQTKAKELVLQEFQRRLSACMDQLADLRDPGASSRAEARTAIGIQQRVIELQKTLSQWFSHFVGVQVGRDPWLVLPPADLREALVYHVDAESSRVADAESDSDGA